MSSSPSGPSQSERPSNRVVESVVAYHPIVATWIRAHLRLISTPSSHVTAAQVNLLDKALYPKPDSLIPINTIHRPQLNILLASDTDPASLRAHVTTVLEEKMSLYKQTHPTLDAASVADLFFSRSPSSGRSFPPSLPSWCR